MRTTSYRRKSRQPCGPVWPTAPSKQTLALAISILCSYDIDGKRMKHFTRYAVDKQSNLCRYLLHRRYVQTGFSRSNLLTTTSHDLHIPPLSLGLCSPTADCSVHPSCDTSQDPTSSSDCQSSPRKTLRPTTGPRFLRQILSEQ